MLALTDLLLNEPVFSPQVLCFGEARIDRYRAAGVIRPAIARLQNARRGAGNVACAWARLGKRCRPEIGPARHDGIAARLPTQLFVERGGRHTALRAIRSGQRIVLVRP